MMKGTTESLGFQLPPEITFQKEHGPTGWFYSFRHRELGELGRILLQGRSDGHTQVVVEISGDSNDPMTEQRKSVFAPVAMEITQQMDLATGGTGTIKPSDPTPYKKPWNEPQGFQTT